MATNPAEIMAAGQALVPNTVTQDLQRQMAHLQIAGANLQNQAQAQQIRMQQIALQRQQSFGGDMQSYLRNPSAEGISGLFAKYPEFAAPLKDAYSAMDEQRRRNDTTQIGSAASLAARGDYQGAANLLQARIAADKAAGHDASTDQAMYDHLTSNDPAQQKAALGMMTIALGAAVGPEHAADFLKANGMDRAPISVGMEDRLVDPSTGQVITGASPKLVAGSVKMPDGTEHPVFGNPAPGTPGGGMWGPAALGGVGGPAASGSPAPAAASPTGAPLLQAMLPITAASESGNRDFNPDGSPVVSPKGAKGRMQVMPGTNVDPGFGVRPAADDSPEERTRVGQDYLAAMMQRYGGDPARAWAAYNAGPGRLDRALASGGNWLAKMPPDTRKYVMANMSQLRGPQTAMAATGTASDAMPGAAPTGGAPAAPAAASQSIDPYTGVPTGGPAPLNTKEAPPGYAWNAGHTAVEPIPGAETDPNSYSSDQIDDMAKQMIVTGQMPSMGMGGAKLKNVVLARRSQLMRQLGITADQLPAIQSRYAADKTALAQNTALASGLASSEGALRANAQQVLSTHQQLAKDGILTDGMPMMNRGRLTMYGEVGSAATKAHIKAYEDAVNAYSTEYAKFMSSASGMSNAPSSDSARNQAGELNDLGLGPTALRAHLNQSLTEALNKRNAVDRQTQTLQQRIGSYLMPGGAHATPVQVKSVQQYNALPKGAPYIDPNGVHRVKQ